MNNQPFAPYGKTITVKVVDYNAQSTAIERRKLACKENIKDEKGFIFYKMVSPSGEITFIFSGEKNS